MRVQLWRDVAEQSDIELLDRKAASGPDRANPGAGRHDLLHQSGAVIRPEILDLARRLEARHEHDPGPSRIVLQPNGAEPEIGDRVRGLREGGGECEHGLSLAGWAPAV
jgi:hypothetical protein